MTKTKKPKCVVEPPPPAKPKPLTAAERKRQTDATRPLRFRIDKQHVDAAQCGDPEHCVVAEALRDAVGEMFDTIHVGASITKIVQGDRVIRYATPAKLRKAIPEFDRTKRWNLAPGEYRLDAPKGKNAIGRKHGFDAPPSAKPKDKPKRQATFTPRAAPSRIVTRCTAL